MQPDRLRKIVLDAPEQRLLCVGDVMLDTYIYGDVERMSPEAPVPVLNYSEAVQMPGGAANTARNLAALGARTRLLSVIGDDAAGAVLTDLLAEAEHIDAHLLVQEASRTTEKTRYLSSGQQLLRLDRDADLAAGSERLIELHEMLDEAAEGANIVLVSDYNKGVISPDVILAALQVGASRGVPVIVDPKGNDLSKYGPVDLLKPNAAELSALVNMPTDTDEEIEAALNMAMELSAAKAILVTRAAKGLSFVERGTGVTHRAGVARTVFDVSGAGDTVLAALGIALASGAALTDAADFALAASGLVVEKSGTAVISAAELLVAHDTKVSDTNEILLKIKAWRDEGQSVGFTNGCFDILHPGHLRVLQEAKARCGRLIVGLNSDASVRRLKGETRPVNDQIARARVLAGLAAVDGVVMFEEDTPARLIEAIVPDLLVKGGDYTEETIVGAETVRKAGGKVYIVPLLDGFSTSAAIERAQEKEET